MDDDDVFSKALRARGTPTGGGGWCARIVVVARAGRLFRPDNYPRRTRALRARGRRRDYPDRTAVPETRARLIIVSRRPRVDRFFTIVRAYGRGSPLVDLLILSRPYRSTIHDAIIPVVAHVPSRTADIVFGFRARNTGRRFFPPVRRSIPPPVSRS